MKIIIDECLPKRVTRFFESASAYTVPQIGLSGYSDTQLLSELDKREIDVFVTIDGNIEYQQQFAQRSFGTIVLASVSNRYEDLLHLKESIVQATKTISPGQVVHIS